MHRVCIRNRGKISTNCVLTWSWQSSVTVAENNSSFPQGGQSLRQRLLCRLPWHGSSGLLTQQIARITRHLRHSWTYGAWQKRCTKEDASKFARICVLALVLARFSDQLRKQLFSPQGLPLPETIHHLFTHAKFGEFAHLAWTLGGL